MIYRIEVKEKSGIFDAVGEGIKRDIADLGIKGVNRVSFIQVYLIEGEFSSNHIRKISSELLADRVVQDFSINSLNNNTQKHSRSLKSDSLNSQRAKVIEIAYNPGVMDPVEESTLKGIRDLRLGEVKAVRTAKKFIIYGSINKKEFDTICEKLLCNKLIQHITKDNKSSFRSLTAQADVVYNFNLVKVELLKARDKDLVNISKNGQLFLSQDEMRQIREYFKKQRRNPTDCELETIAQTWSEHCGHKTFRGIIEYLDKCSNKKTLINNLLKSTIMKVTNKLNLPWCVSVFKDNSGVIRFDDKFNVCFKVETHNHPSALEPFGGANTGIGGVIRDPLGTGLGAKPILNTDVFCFGPPDLSFKKLPKGVLHPKRIMKGVVSGVRDYGNKMGIPTTNGAILFDERYVGNPLVYCGTVGIMPKDKSFKKVYAGDLIVLVGGRTGRDGIHGATFSSGELTGESEVVSSGAVQIGNPIQEKKMVDTILEARDRNLYNAITDCGGGGLSSAVGEMGADLGCRVNLEKVPLKYKDLSYTEIWISEAQERMILAVPKDKMRRLLEIFSKEDVEATIIGEFTNNKRLQLLYNNNLVCDLDMEFLHEGLPRIKRKAVWSKPKFKEPKFKCPPSLTVSLKEILSSWNVCSKEWVIRQYDHEVQGGSIIKPLVGINNDGPSDACIVKPILNSKKGVIVSNGINFNYGLIDPYWMAASCIDEALRQIIAVGGSLRRVALLDNFCWGNPNKLDRLGNLVRATFGCYDAALKYRVPFISGKDSLNNEYTVNRKSISIPGTLLISAIAVMDDISKAVSMDAKNPRDLIYIIGETFDELGGSEYFKLHGAVGNKVPQVSPGKARRTMSTLSKATDKGLVAASHDCSEGGLAVAAAEMAFAGGYGMEIFLNEVPFASKSKKRNDFILFSESNSRFVVEVSSKNQKQFERLFKDLPIGLIGCISKDKEFRIHGLAGKICIQADIDELKESWQKPLRW